MNWALPANYAIDAAALLLLTIGLLSSLINVSVNKQTQRFFVLFFSFSLLYVISNLAFLAFESRTKIVVGTQVSVFMESFFSSVLMPLLTVYILRCCGENVLKSPLMVSVFILWLAFISMLTAAQLTDLFYYITPDNVYHRGVCYPALLVPLVLIMAANLIYLIIRHKKLSRNKLSAFIIYTAFPMSAMVFQMWIYGLSFIIFATTVSAAIMLLFIINDQTDEHLRQAEENARQRTSIAVLQMRPHFTYNTMMSIYYLIEQDAEKARQVTLDFTSYLRKNFTAVAKEDTIPFVEELEHTRAYLAVEKVRFEDRLFVEFDTPHTMFRLPPLTLQPIVENSVKYGVDPELDPLHISVSTRETDDGFEVVVDDTGPGFGFSDNNEPHVALANISERLRIMCGGRLSIAPREGGGISVTVFIPKKST